MIDLRNGDCLEILKNIPDNSIDLIVTDPPYQIDNTKAGGNSSLAKSIQKMNDEIKEKNLTNGFDEKILEELKEELGTEFDDYMYKANIELLNKINKAIEYIEYIGMDDAFDKVLLEILKGENND